MRRPRRPGSTSDSRRVDLPGADADRDRTAGPRRVIALVGAVAVLTALVSSTAPGVVRPSTPGIAPSAESSENRLLLSQATDESGSHASDATRPHRAGGPTRAFANASAARFHVPILMYHLVGGSDDPGALRDLVVSARLFDDQLADLRDHGWRTLALATLAEDLLTDQPPPPRSFVITLDDGHVDGYTVALPILRRLGDTATFFVITDRIGRTGYLSGSNLRTLVRDGMGIGNHTVSHPDLARLNALAARNQIEDAQMALAAILGAPPAVFAYPSGEADPAVEADAAAAGIDLAVGNQPGVLETLGDRFLVPRVRVSPGTTPVALLAEMDAARSAQ